jgi:hypothetical protein
MKIERLSAAAQEGLRKWASWQHDDELLFDNIVGSPEHWSWIVFQLRVADDRPEWFPKGKSATIQIIESWIYDEAKSLKKSK